MKSMNNLTDLKTAQVYAQCGTDSCAFQLDISIYVEGASSDSIASQVPSIEVYRYSDKKLVYTFDETNYQTLGFSTEGEFDLTSINLVNYFDRTL